MWPAGKNFGEQADRLQKSQAGFLIDAPAQACPSVEHTT
jgi:hypothetical protein